MLPLMGALIAIGEEQLGPRGGWWPLLLPAKQLTWQLKICLLELTGTEGERGR